MENDILDEDLLGKRDYEKPPTLSNWTSLLLLWAGIASGLYAGFLFETKFVFAVLLLAMTSMLTYLNFQVGVKVTLFVILIGTLGLLNFFPNNIDFRMTIFGLTFGFELYLFFIGLIHFFTNKKILSKFIFNLFNRRLSEEEKIADSRSSINGFKRRFSNKEITELEQIANDKDLVAAAKQAAQELILERKEAS